MKISIDFFEYCFLLEACIPPAPIARTHFFQESIDNHYNLMTDEERTKVYNWMWDKIEPKKDAMKVNYYDYELLDMWLARYNPNNQYLVTTNYNNELKDMEVFKYKDKFHVNRTTSIIEDYIVDVKQKEL